MPEFIHFASYGSAYDPTWYNHYQPNWTDAPKAAAAEKEKEREIVTELKVNLCCDGCVEKVHKTLKSVDGVESVYCEPDINKVTVRGSAKADRVLKEVRKIKKHSELFKQGKK